MISSFEFLRRFLINIDHLKIVIDTITALEDRRQIASSTHVAVIAGVAVFSSTSTNTSSGAIALISILVSISWLLSIKGYTDILKAKWHVADKIQKQIEFEPFIEEKNELIELNRVRSLSISNTEKIVPISIIIIAFAILIFNPEPFFGLSSVLKW